ncbi:Gfo/Idh/MocA family protein [Pseudovibrio ascidiaceicola]|uniref:Gfo/Idh/MocA family protein n=1 Tax=Pseudovibrio ascidiaceicola TaxID=285279 RepID=UPI003D3619B6
MEIGIGLIGAGCMGKLHAVALNAAAAVFNTKLRARLEMICTTTEDGAQEKAEQFGFARSTSDWSILVNDPRVEAIVIASPQTTHRKIALEAFKLGKPVLCEKPLGASLSDANEMAHAAEASGQVNLVGFNYIRTPATQLAHHLIKEGVIGDITFFRGEHTEDFFANPETPATWRSSGDANGTMGDLAPHLINCAHVLVGPIKSVCAQIETVFKTRPSECAPNIVEQVTNDDVAQFMCTFESGVTGHLLFSRVALGKKMGIIYEITGTKGALRFDQEDQNALWLYKIEDRPEQSGFRKILTNPTHPDYAAFCHGPGHGTGYQDQLIIEARDFLEAIATGTTNWPTFKDGLEVAKVVDAARRSHKSGSWVEVN